MSVVLKDRRLPANYETKTFHFEVKSVDEDQGIIRGYLNTKNGIDNQTDRTKDGAYKKTISDAYSRKSSKGKKFLWAFLWFHEPTQPIGGFLEAEEDHKGLLTDIWCDITKNEQGIPNNPIATMVFSGLKNGYIDELSVGYRAIKTNYVTEKIDGKTVNVREILEMQIWEGSACTTLFAADPNAEVTGVKSMGIDTAEIEEKSVCGDTSLPIGPRNESWDGSAAKKQIFDWAEKEDGTIDASKAKKCFLQVDGDTSLKGSYGYPFCNIVNGSPRINVGGVKACAGALSGSRGASTSGGDIEGMRRKVATMYSRINKANPDAEELTPPWNEKDKASDTPVNRKTFDTHFAEGMCEDLLSNWQGVYLPKLTNALLDALKTGEAPTDDISDVLDAFKSRVLGTFVTQATEYGLPQYLAEKSIDHSYLSRHAKPEGKAGARFGANSRQALQAHADALNSMAEEHKTLSDQLAAQQKSMKAMKQTVDDHIAGLQQKASDLTNIFSQEGQGPAYAEDNTDTSKSNSQAEETTRREPPQQALTRTPETQPRTLTEEDEIKALEAAFAGWMKK